MRSGRGMARARQQPCVVSMRTAPVWIPSFWWRFRRAIANPPETSVGRADGGDPAHGRASARHFDHERKTSLGSHLCIPHLFCVRESTEETDSGCHLIPAVATAKRTACARLQQPTRSEPFPPIALRTERVLTVGGVDARASHIGGYPPPSVPSNAGRT